MCDINSFILRHMLANTHQSNEFVRLTQTCVIDTTQTHSLCDGILPNTRLSNEFVRLAQTCVTWRVLGRTHCATVFSQTLAYQTSSCGWLRHVWHDAYWDSLPVRRYSPKHSPIKRVCASDYLYVTLCVHVWHSHCPRTFPNSPVKRVRAADPFICDMTRACATWLLHVWRGSLWDMIRSQCVVYSKTRPSNKVARLSIHTWLLIRDMTCTCVTWRVMCDVTFSPNVTRRIFKNSPVKPVRAADSFIRDITSTCVVWRIHVWRDASTCDMTLILRSIFKNSPVKRVRAAVQTPPWPQSAATTPRDPTPQEVREAQKRVTHTHTHTHAHTRTRVYAHIYTYTHAYTHTHSQVKEARTRITHMYTHTRIYTHTYTHTYTGTHTHAYTHTQTYAHTHTCTHTRIYTHTCTHTHIHTRTHTYKYTHVCARTHACTHTHIHKHTC